MKISIEGYGMTFTAELSDESVVDDVVEKFARLLFAYGYSHDNIVESMKHYEDDSM